MTPRPDDDLPWPSKPHNFCYATHPSTWMRLIFVGLLAWAVLS